jgi:hypothetical protein
LRELLKGRVAAREGVALEPSEGDDKIVEEPAFLPGDGGLVAEQGAPVLRLPGDRVVAGGVPGVLALRAPALLVGPGAARQVEVGEAHGAQRGRGRRWVAREGGLHAIRSLGLQGQ